MAAQDVMVLVKARSLLTILIATCEQTLLALEAAANVVDTDMTEDLRLMIARTQSELDVLIGQIAALRA